VTSFLKITIEGIRGYGETQTLNLAQPNSLLGSGLSCIVGPNNSGKSTIYESFRAISQNGAPSFTEGKRNKEAGDKICLRIFRDEKTYLELTSIEFGGSETIFKQHGITENDVKIFTLPSRRTFNPFFGKNPWDRNVYLNNSHFQSIRANQNDNFSNRLFKIQQDPHDFNLVLAKVLDEVPNWNIEQSDSGQYYLKFNFNKANHNSDGAGEGLLSLFTIVDALYDSNVNDIIVIDEPELSLHPALQKKLLNLFLEYAKTRQIIILTHSPYLISWDSLFNGGKLARVIKEESNSRIYELSPDTIGGLKSFKDNLFNPHILGIDSKEVFFLHNKIILVEGQEDVIYYHKILELLDHELDGEFYGWGVGGADNMDKIIPLLNDLGFTKIAVILDDNKKQNIPSLSSKYNYFHFTSIPSEDVVIKPKQQDPTTMTTGLINRGGTILTPEYIEDIKEIFKSVNNYFEVSQIN
jgi:predicted ATP-dependent endonuclease of OLD family